MLTIPELLLNAAAEQQYSSPAEQRSTPRGILECGANALMPCTGFTWRPLIPPAAPLPACFVPDNHERASCRGELLRRTPRVLTQVPIKATPHVPV